MQRVDQWMVSDTAESEPTIQTRTSSSSIPNGDGPLPVSSGMMILEHRHGSRSLCRNTPARVTSGISDLPATDRNTANCPRLWAIPMTPQPEPLPRVGARKYTRAARVHIRIKGSGEKGRLYRGIHLLAECANCYSETPKTTGKLG